MAEFSAEAAATKTREEAREGDESGEDEDEAPATPAASTPEPNPPGCVRLSSPTGKFLGHQLIGKFAAVCQHVTS